MFDVTFVAIAFVTLDDGNHRQMVLPRRKQRPDRSSLNHGTRG